MDVSSTVDTNVGEMQSSSVSYPDDGASYAEIESNILPEDDNSSALLHDAEISDNQVQAIEEEAFLSPAFLSELIEKGVERASHERDDSKVLNDESEVGLVSDPEDSDEVILPDTMAITFLPESEKLEPSQDTAKHASTAIKFDAESNFNKRELGGQEANASTNSQNALLKSQKSSDDSFEKLIEKADNDALHSVDEPSNSMALNAFSLERTDEQTTSLPLNALGQQLSDFFNNQVASSQVKPDGLISTEVFKGAEQSQVHMEMVEWEPSQAVNLSEIQMEEYTAKVKIYPPELGEISAKIAIEEGSASVTLMTEHSHVKQIMESNLGQLKQSFENAQVELTNVDIQQGGSGRGEREDRQQQQHGQSTPSNEPQEKSAMPIKKRSSALVDTYA